MKNLEFPLDLKFRITTLSNDFTVSDASGKTIAYIRQKMFKFKEHVQVFNDESKATVLYDIKANKWLDFNTSYAFIDANGQEAGRIVRKGWASIWRSRYEIYDENQQQDLLIQEKDPWVKVWDSLVGELPVVSMFTGYLFNPSYTVKRPDGTEVACLKKEPSFFGRKFKLNKVSEFEQGEETRIVLGLMMMILLERRRG